MMKGSDMDSRSNSIESVLPQTVRSAWYAFGLWLRLVIVGLGMLATGVALLLERFSSPAPGLAWLVGGGAFAAFSWRRCQTALARLHSAEETAGASDNLSPGGHAPAIFGETLFGLSARATALE
jgi:hypothetical protein